MVEIDESPVMDLLVLILSRSLPYGHTRPSKRVKVAQARSCERKKSVVVGLLIASESAQRKEKNMEMEKLLFFTAVTSHGLTHDTWVLHIAKVGYFFPHNMEWLILKPLLFFFHQKLFIFHFLENL